MRIFYPNFYKTSYSMFTLIPCWYSYWTSCLQPYAGTRDPLHSELSGNRWACVLPFLWTKPKSFFNPICYLFVLKCASPAKCCSKTSARIQSPWDAQWSMAGRVHPESGAALGETPERFCVNWKLPDFVKEDLRQVYGTYPSTSVWISYQNGEFLVRGNPCVGEQEYKWKESAVKGQVFQRGIV